METGPDGWLGVFEHTWSLETIAIVTFLAVSDTILRLLRSARDRWEARHYNISGEDVALFGDKRSGKDVMNYSNLTIRQNGTNMFGLNTTYPEKGHRREWVLRGRIFYGTILIGNYEERAPGSRSVGSFFVAKKTEGSGDFEGFWSGWDEVNHMINSGSYSFLKKPKTELKIAKDNDMARIAEISEECFGTHYFEFGVAEAREKYKQTSEIITARERETKSIVGYSFMYMLPKNELGRFLRIDQESYPIQFRRSGSAVLSDELLNANNRGKIGVIQTIALSTEKRSRGIGLDLLHNTEKRLMNYFPNLILAPAWSVDEKTSAGGLLEKSGYVSVFTSNDFWKEDYDNGKFHCPARNNSGCRCKMVLYKKTC